MPYVNKSTLEHLLMRAKQSRDSKGDNRCCADMVVIEIENLLRPNFRKREKEFSERINKILGADNTLASTQEEWLKSRKMTEEKE